MDRFIVRTDYQDYFRLTHLKSNMDRFIEDTGISESLMSHI